MSSELDIKFPEIYYDGTKIRMYEYLKTELNRTYADIFLFAMAFAKKNKIPPKELEKPTKLSPGAFSVQMRVFMRSIMIAEHNDVYVIRDNNAVRRMCEKYANAGIGRVYMKIKNRNIEKNVEDILAELIQS